MRIKQMMYANNSSETPLKRWNFFVRSICLLLLLFLFSYPINAQTQSKEKKLKVVLDEKTLDGVEYILIEDTEYLPLDEVKKIYDAKTHWYPVSGKIILNLDGKKVEFFIETKKVLVNGIQRKLDQPIRLINDEVYLPISFLEGPSWQKITGGKTFWDWSKETLTFTQKISSPAPSETVSPTTVTLSSTITTGKVEGSVPPLPSKEIVLPKEKKFLRIVIDPGHGGKDPGAIGRRGTKEKEINLIIAKELANVLKENYGYEILLTREDDTFLSLYERTEMANRNNADLFVSVHCNASRSRQLKGFEVYFLSEKATDADAEATASMENAVLALEDIPPWKQKEIEKILRSMETNVFLNQSGELAGLLAKQMEKDTDISDPRVRQASFAVLRGARMPAILVEAGFLTYRNEETKLRSQKYRKQIAKSLAKSINLYYQRNNNSRKAEIK